MGVELDTLFFWHCESAEGWSTVVEGSNGETYTVEWSDHLHKNQDSVQYDYSCTCPSYKFGNGDCKHISKVREEGNHCRWLQFHDGGDVAEKDGEPTCPKCGSSVRSMGWAV